MASLLFLRPPLDPTDARGARGVPRIQSATGVDSIVFVALGPAARSPSLLYALASLREEGLWDGPVHVIVEHEDDLDCLSSFLRQGVSTIVAGGGGSGSGGGWAGLSGNAAADGKAGKYVPDTRSASMADIDAGEVWANGPVRRDPGLVPLGEVGDSVGEDAEDNLSGEGEAGGVVAVNAKMVKMRLLDLLPDSVQRVVYVDCDVITQRPLWEFLQAVAREWNEVDAQKAVRERAEISAAAQIPDEALSLSVDSFHLRARGRGSPEAVGAVGEAAPPSSIYSRPNIGSVDNADQRNGHNSNYDGIHRRHHAQPSTLIIFPDAAGHTVPVCSGCDTAHSGVVALARGHSELCLELWRDAFSGNGGMEPGTATDQEALDIALRKGSGCEARFLDRHHMHFMKDLFVMAGLTSKSTFGHFTGLLHPERLNSQYKRYYAKFLGRSIEDWENGVIKACAME